MQKHVLATLALLAASIALAPLAAAQDSDEDEATLLACSSEPTTEERIRCIVLETMTVVFTELARLGNTASQTYAMVVAFCHGTTPSCPL